MRWNEALEAIRDNPHIRRYRQACAEDNRDTHLRDRFRDHVVRIATGGDPSAYPDMIQQAKNFAGAMGNFAASGFQVVDDAEQERRLAICHACEHFDREHGRCRVCGCVAAWKSRIMVEHCPLPEPRW